MTEGPERRAAGPRSARDSGAPADLDLSSHDWRGLIEQLPLAVYIDRLDEWSSNIYTSPQIEAILGYTTEEWAGEDHLLLSVLHPDDRERVMAAHLRSCETGEPFRMEYRMIARDGRVVWFLDQATGVPGQPGRPGFHHGFLLDITERKQLEGALAESTEELGRQKRYFESLLEISPVAIVTTDLEDVVTSWNPAAERLFGYAAREALGRKIDDLVASSAELSAEAAAVTRDALREGRVQAITRRAHRDGSLIDVELLASPVVLHGEPVGTYAIYHDLRELKRAEERYRALVEGLPLVTYVGEPDERATSIYVSPQIEALLGYAPEEWLADPELFLRRLHPDDRERVLAEHERAFAAGESNWSSDYRLVSRDGRTVWLHDEALIVRDEHGTPLYVQGFQVDVSERKRAEEALRESEQRFRAMFEEAPVGVAWGPLDATTMLVPTALRRPGGRGPFRWNRAYREMLGYSEEELQALHFSEYTHPEDLPRQLALYRDLAAGKIERYEIEMRYIARDGRVIWAHVVDSIVRDEDGGALFGLTMVEDITERKLAEEALLRSEAEVRRQKQYFESLVEISPTAVLTLDLEERVTSWNPAAERLFGYSKGEAVGRPIADLTLRPEDLGERAVLMQQVSESGSARLTTRRRRKDGSLVDVEVLVVALDADGERVGSYVIYHDISELQRRKQYLEALLELSPTAIVTIDLNGDVTSWNPAAQRLFGYTRQEAVGRNVDDLVARSDGVRGEAVDVSQQLREGEEIYLTTQRTRKDGTLVDVDVRAAPIFVGADQVGMYALYHDVSELRRAYREAEAATVAKSAFLATMSHEIRTPLNAVIGMTELLLGTELTPEQRDLAHVVNTSGDALLGVINEILDFSKIEAGRLQLEHRPLVLRDCVESALEMVAATAAGKGLDVACLIDPDAPAAILGDGTRLRQILVNLLTNAVKFTERGEVVLTVEWQAAAPVDEAGDGHPLHFTVRDTGIGIPADRIDGLFESFSQMDASTTRRYGGTGLGLAISKRLCEMMGGEMWAESEAGKGSAFHFTVAAKATSGPRFPPVAAELRGKRLLVVDDNAANREVIMRQARSWGMVPRESGSPAQALEWIRRGDPLDIAILDMQMPEMDGLTLAREIRGYRAADALPLVMLTSLGRRTEDREARGEFAAILTKPIRASQLYDAVAAVIGAELPRPQQAPEAEPDATAGARAQLRVLLAEDNAVNQQLALRMLETLGYAADVAVNGLEALAALRRRPYDVVLMDVEMPEMDGLEAARCIHREWPGDERPRIVAMTANAMQGDREICLAAGMDDYVSKPVHMDELAEALSRCTPRAVGVQEAPSPASAAADEDGVLDPEALEQLCARAGDRAFVVELVDTFVRDAPRLLETLRGALADAEAQRLRRAAHTLKSNGRLFGATTLAELCQELEAIAKAGSLAGAAELVARIDEEYARVADALQAAGQEMT
jgi:PAS domain S-box-containing protein